MDRPRVRSEIVRADRGAPVRVRAENGANRGPLPREAAEVEVDEAIIAAVAAVVEAASNADSARVSRARPELLERRNPLLATPEALAENPPVETAETIPAAEVAAAEIVRILRLKRAP
jgi:hypothetical protein